MAVVRRGVFVKRLTVLAVSVATTVLTALPSQAAPPFAGPACTVLTDAPGDETFFGPTGQAGSDPALDLLAATLRSDGKTLHASIRVADLSTPLVEGRTWSLDFGTENSGYELHAVQAVDGVTFAAYGPGGDADKPSRGYVTGRLDDEGRQVLMDVPLRQLGIGPQVHFSDFKAASAHGLATAGAHPGPASIGSQDATLGADDGASHKRYRLDRGCSTR